MPDSKLSALPAGATPVDADLFYSDQSATSVKVTALQLKTYTSSGSGASIGGPVVGGTPGSVLFVGAGPVLAQDNANFFWDDTNHSLNLSGFPALYQVPNVSGESWFVGHAGNFTISGRSNLGAGKSALAALTTGQENIGIGEATFTLLNGNFNTGIGFATGSLMTSGAGNTFAGYGSGSAFTSGSFNTVLGYFGAVATPSGSANTLLGGWWGSASAMSNVIALSDGGSGSGGALHLDYNFSNAGKWTTDSPLAFKGSSSGTVTVTTKAVAGTWTLTLPDTAGTNNFVLQTDGTGITSWIAPGAATIAIGSPVTGGTAQSVLFVDSGGNLGQDGTHFTFDPTSNILNVGFSGAPGKYTLNSIPAIYRVPNASGDNWFEGNSGNTTLTGFQNFGTGDLTLSSLTTGSQNTCVGSKAGQNLTTGVSNFVFGSNALQFCQLDSDNTAIGVNCLQVLGLGGAGGGGNTSNFAAGFAALANAVTGFNNVAIGFVALANATAAANQNVVIGGGAGSNLGVGGGNVSDNTLVGCNSGTNLTGSSNSNTWIGGFAGPSAVVFHTIAIGTGTAAAELLDLGLSTNHVWTFGAVQNGQTPTGLHVYNIQDTGSLGLNASIINYERGCIDWNLTSNVFRLASQAGGTGTVRLIAIDGFQKAGAPAAADLPSTTWTVINDTTNNQTWLVYNNAGTIRKVQLV